MSIDAAVAEPGEGRASLPGGPGAWIAAAIGLVPVRRFLPGLSR